MMKLYLDACAVNRLLDDQRQLRIRREAEAVEEILGLVQARRVRWIAGAILKAEIVRIPALGDEKMSWRCWRSRTNSRRSRCRSLRGPHPWSRPDIVGLMRSIWRSRKMRQMADHDRRWFSARGEARFGKSSHPGNESGKLAPGKEAMKTVEKMTDEQLERHALDILGRELGPHGLARFLRSFRSGTDNYTAQRNRRTPKTTVRNVAKAANSSRAS